MNVTELREALEKCDPNTRVAIIGFGGGYVEVTVIESLSMVVDRHTAATADLDVLEIDPWINRAHKLSGTVVPTALLLQADPALLREQGRNVIAPKEPTPEPAEPDAPKDPLKELQDLYAEIQSIHDLGYFAPTKLRAMFALWAADARELAGPCPSSVVEYVTSTIFHTLSSAGRRYWPGYTPHLRRDFRGPPPAQVRRDADAELAALDADPDLDCYGWADGAALQPPPAHPDELLAHIRSELTAHFGDLDAPPPAHTELDLVELAQQLRWCRTHCSDPDLWGATAGFLRRLASEADLYPLVHWLDPKTQPNGAYRALSWAALFKPAAPQRDVLREVALAALTDVNDFPAWFEGYHDRFDAATLEQELRARDGFANLEKLRDDLALGWLSGSHLRGARAKFNKLLRRLGRPSTPEPEPAPARPYLEVDLVPEEQHPVVVQARQHVAGKSLAFVTNRDESSLMAEYETAFGATFEHLSLEHNNPKNVVQRVKAGRYDLVLLATGFMGHSCEHAIVDACRIAGVGYVRVGKGRLLACARGILSQTQSKVGTLV